MKPTLRDVAALLIWAYLTVVALAAGAWATVALLTHPARTHTWLGLMLASITAFLISGLVVENPRIARRLRYREPADTLVLGVHRVTGGLRRRAGVIRERDEHLAATTIPALAALAAGWFRRQRFTYPGLSFSWRPFPALWRRNQARGVLAMLSHRGMLINSWSNLDGETPFVCGFADPDTLTWLQQVIAPDAPSVTMTILPADPGADDPSEHAAATTGAVDVGRNNDDIRTMYTGEVRPSLVDELVRTPLVLITKDTGTGTGFDLWEDLYGVLVWHRQPAAGTWIHENPLPGKVEPNQD